MIKGRYVVQIVADFSYDKKAYEKLQERFASSWIETALTYQIKRIFSSGNPQVKVTRLLADIYKVGDEDASD